jgi:hypothetical protein
MVIIAAAGLVWLVSLWMGSSRGFNTTVRPEGSSRGSEPGEERS